MGLEAGGEQMVIGGVVVVRSKKNAFIARPVEE
jgi:hypothetical protein